MALTKSVVDIINVQNSCKDVLEELYTFEARPNDVIRASNKCAKIDDALRLEILEYDDFEDELTLSADTEEYFKTRLGQNSDTYIGFIAEKLERLELECRNHNLRMKNAESTQREIKHIYKILNAIPSLLKHNLHSIASNSVFAFKNEPNFEIKMINLKISQEEIVELIEVSKSVDLFLKKYQQFLKTLESKRVNSAVLKVKHNSIELESSFIKLYDDIKNYINQSIKDGEFIKKLQRLKELKDENKLQTLTNLYEKINTYSSIPSSQKEKKLHPDDRIHDFVDTIREIIETRKITINVQNEPTPLSYDIEEEIRVDKRLYNYQKFQKEFLEQPQDLFSFLLTKEIEKERILGVFVRMLKNFSHQYKTEDEEFVFDGTRYYLKIYSL